jgi:hypothetical protein
MCNYGALEKEDLNILSGSKIKALKHIDIAERTNILQLKGAKYLTIFNILATLDGRTDAKALQTQKRYYKTLFFIYYDILKIRKSIENTPAGYMEYQDCLEFLEFEKEHKLFISALSLYREDFVNLKTDKKEVINIIKEMPQEEVIKLLRGTFLEKRLGIRRYKAKKK